MIPMSLRPAPPLSADGARGLGGLTMATPPKRPEVDAG